MLTASIAASDKERQENMLMAFQLCAQFTESIHFTAVNTCSGSHTA